MQLQSLILRSSHAIALGAYAPNTALPVIDKRPLSAKEDIATRTALSVRAAADTTTTTVLPSSSSSPGATSSTTGATNAGPTAGELAMQEARASKSFVGDLVQMRQKGDQKSLEKFAAAMAGKLGIPIEDARVMVDAMSRGGTDATAMASAISTLNAMSTDERSDWLSRVLPACAAAGRAIVAVDDDPTMKTLGAGTDQAKAIGDFTYVSSLMANRNRSAKAKPTPEEEAVRARDAAINRVASSHGARSIQSQALAIDAKGDVDEGLRDRFAASLAKRFGLSVESAYTLIDAMRQKTQVSSLIADGLDKLGHLSDATARNYAGAFARTAQAAVKAEAAIAANAFENRAGAASEEEVRPIGNLADLNAVLKQLATTAAKAAA